MKRHLTEKELIEYRFRLAPDEQAATSGEHVAGCAECRERLERLDRKFATLDLLREDVHASEELIAQVVKQTGGATKTKVVPFYKLKWIGAVAAVLVVGFVLFINNLPELEQARFRGEKSEVADSAGPLPPLDETQVEMGRRSVSSKGASTDSRGRPMIESEAVTDAPTAIVAGTKVEGTGVVNLDSEEVKTDAYAFVVPKEKKALGQVVGEPLEARLQPTKPNDVVSELGLESIPEKPPFAPASAIELVTLPRRDSVQLTIYNTSDSTPEIDEVRLDESGMMGGMGGMSGMVQAQSLINLIQESIEPDTWYDLRDTGEGTIQIRDNKLVVRQTPEVHRKIEKLLQAMWGLPESRAKSSIAIEGTLPKQMETRVYDIADLNHVLAELPNIQQGIRENRASEKLVKNIANTLTLVRERRNLTLKRGWNWLQLMWANTLIDPTSLSLEPLGQADKIDIQQLVFPARLRELGRWLIRSEISGQVPFEITYFTSGVSWRAFYMGTLSQDETSMHLAGYVRVANNSGEDYENAQTRLVVGKVHLLDQIALLAQRQYPYDRPGLRLGEGFDLDGDSIGGAVITNGGWRHFGVGGGMGGFGGMMGGMAPKEIRKEGLSEYFLYTIEGTETIPNEWGKRLLSFEADDVAVESLYKYDEERWGDEAIRFVKFANDEEHKLGDTPIPNGTVRIYSQADEQGFLSYVGGTEVKYIPVDEEVELELGPARLVEIKPKLMDFKTANYVFNDRDNVSGWDEIRTWKIEITNTRTLPVEVEITRGFETPYWTLQSDAPYKKHDATHARFEVSLEPRSKQAIEYVLITYHGEREQTLVQ